MILVTGGTGFVGSRLLKRLFEDGYKTRASVRSPLSVLPEGIQSILIDGMTASTDWSSALKGVQAVIHCASRVHVISDDAPENLQLFRRVNVDGTLNLATQAARSGVRRFVFVSSIKVNGEVTQPGHPFTADDAVAPSDPYGLSKLEAETGLREIEAQSSMEVVIVRPPLVYGPGVKANFASMMSWVASGIPLPLRSVYNYRSLVAVDNLIDLLVTCLKHPAAAGHIFLVSDGEDVSTTELLWQTAKAMNKKVLLFPVPFFVLEFGAALLGKREVAQRLLCSLQVDIKKTSVLLGWNPPLTLVEGLKKAVEGRSSETVI